MIRILKNNWPFFILLILAFLTRFLFLSYPAEVVFDEVHFGKFVSAYFTHQYYFDIHPPLGKLMIAGFAELFGFQGNFDFSKIGEVFNAENLFILRFLPALFGALFILLIYKFVLLVGLSTPLEISRPKAAAAVLSQGGSLTGLKKAAFLAGFLILFDNAFLVESKFILVDIFLLFFGFSALYLFILARRKKYQGNSSPIINNIGGNCSPYIFYSFSAIFAGLAFSIKWTGLSFWAIIFLFIFLDFLKSHKIKEFLIKSVIFIFVPFIIYFSIFAIHFNLLQKSGPGDAFMTPNFRTENVFQKFVELNQKMYFYSSTLKTGHQDASKWFEWPKMSKPVWYWTRQNLLSQNLGKQAQDKIANIYLVGNPLIWWLAALIIPISILLLFIKKIRRKLPSLFYLFLLGYFANLLPFIFINRVAFLYHYLPSLTFGILIFVLLTEKLLSTFAKGYGGSSEALREGGKNNYLYFSFLFLVILIFLIFSPLSYGFLVSPGINQFYKGFINFLH